MWSDNRLELWAMDEVKFQQHGSRCQMWVPPEVSAPVVFHHPTRKSVGYFGAIRIRDGKLVYRNEPEKFNGPTFHTFLKVLRKLTARTSRQVVLLLDNARYHHAKIHKEWRNACKARFILDFLPPYSPELNPIERVWKLTRRLCTHNKYFPNLTQVIATVESQFDRWRGGSEIIRKLCAIN